MDVVWKTDKANVFIHINFRVVCSELSARALVESSEHTRDADFLLPVVITTHSEEKRSTKLMSEKYKLLTGPEQWQQTSQLTFGLKVSKIVRSEGSAAGRPNGLNVSLACLQNEQFSQRKSFVCCQQLLPINSSSNELDG